LAIRAATFEGTLSLNWSTTAGSSAKKKGKGDEAELEAFVETY